MRKRDFFWESEEVFGEYFNSDIAEFKRTRSEIRVTAAARCEQRVVARQGTTLGVFGVDGGAVLEKVPAGRFELSRIGRMAFSPDGEYLAVGDGHLVQYCKFQGHRLMPTGRLAGEKVPWEVPMLDLAFVDHERCLGVSQRAVLLFERGVCLWQKDLQDTQVRLQGELALVVQPERMAVYRSADWELLEEWRVGTVLGFALSAGGRAAWLQPDGLHLRLQGVVGEVLRHPPTAQECELAFAGERLLIQEKEGKAWHWRPELPSWSEASRFLGTSGLWWFEQTDGGFRAFADDRARPA